MWAMIQKRPEINPEALKRDLTAYYLPYLQKLIELKSQIASHQSVIVGVSAVQGTGKTTQGEILEILLKHFGYSSISRSIDDHYITHRELCELRQADPRFIRRGVTHDIKLAMTDLSDLREMKDGDAILVSGYDKGVQHGDGDRLRWINLVPGMVVKASVVEEEIMINKALERTKVLHLTSATYQGKELTLPDNMGADVPLVEHFMPLAVNVFLRNFIDEEYVIEVTDEATISFRGQGEVKAPLDQFPNGWRLVTQNPAFIFYDGWMLGARRESDESVFDQNLPALETPEAKEFAKFVNRKLDEYEPLWQTIDFLNVLYEPHYEMSLKWRDQAEDALRSRGEGMSHDEIREFIYYFWRSVHPAIHIKHLAQDSQHTKQVVIINDDHTVQQVLTPDQVKEKYP